MEKYIEVERSIIKKYRKEIWKRFIAGINEYKLIEPGDKIAVCISGGKDSMLLAKCIQHLQKISEATRKVAKGDFSVEIELDETLKENSYINIMFRDFNTMVAELNSIESLKDDFISNVSHEIKTPLSIINNYTTALKDKDLPEKLREEYRKRI